MLKPLLQAQNHSPSLFFTSSLSPIIYPIAIPKPRYTRSQSRQSCRRREATPRALRVRCEAANEAAAARSAASAATATKSPAKVKVVVTVQSTVGGALSNVGITRGLDDIADLLGKTLLLELVSCELDPGTGLEKENIASYAHKTSQHGDKVRYEGEFSVPSAFGEVGAVAVENEHHKEMYLHDIVLSAAGDDDDDATSLAIDCRSWVHSKFDNPEKRVFFTSKVY